MTRLLRLVAIGVAAGIALAGTSTAQPPPPPPPTVAPALVSPAQEAKPPQAPQSEADKKLAAIIKGGSEATDAATMVARLEQFIRENPTYPRMESAYSNLLMFASMLTANPKKTLVLADQALKRFPDPKSTVRLRAVQAKLMAYRTQKNEKAIRKLGKKLLDSEQNPSVLQTAAQLDRANSVKLFEKAIAERAKNPDATALPTLDALRWDYAMSLNAAGRKAEALRLSLELLEQGTEKAIAELEALPVDDPKRRQLTVLRRTARGRYRAVATLYEATGEFQKALDYVDRAERSGGDAGLEAAAGFESQRAGIYAKMGRTDLELECYVRSFAARMDPKTRDTILKTAAKTGMIADEAFSRARALRAQNAVVIKGFELKSLDGPVVTLDSFRSKATLVNFFFPT